MDARQRRWAAHTAEPHLSLLLVRFSHAAKPRRDGSGLRVTADRCLKGLQAVPLLSGKAPAVTANGIYDDSQSRYPYESLRRRRWRTRIGAAAL